MSVSESLGQEHDVRLPTARIRYRECGDPHGPPVVFVHGLLVNGDLWRAVAPKLAEGGFRCITPDWPFGAHDVPVPDADLTPTGVATLIAQFLAALELTDCTVVANDTGGGLTQILMAGDDARVGRVALTPSDSFERFFPPVFSFLPPLARIPGSTWLLAQALRARALHRLPFTFGWLAKRPMPEEITESYLTPSRRSPAIRKDLRRFLAGIDNRHTLAAASRLAGFDKPVLLAWAREDKLFPISLAHRLANTLPRATVVPIEDSYTFVPEDRPDELARILLEFLRAHQAT